MRSWIHEWTQARSLPWVPLADRPTAVEQLDDRLWVKHESRINPEFGGNKIRKLEWLLGDARERGRTRIVTSGGIGSSHALATAHHGTAEGFDVEIAVFPHHVTDTSRATLRAMASTGASLHWCPTDNLVPVVMGRLALQNPSKTKIVLPGGSQGSGVVGAVDLGLEIAAQIKAGDLPSVDRVVVPYGSGGTAAGLAMGLHIAASSARVTAVRVYPLPLTSSIWLKALQVSASQHLERFGVNPPRPQPVEIIDGYLGDGYAEPTDAATRALDSAADVGLKLEGTYTAKAFAAVRDLLAKSNERILYISTFDPSTPPPRLSEPVLPEKLREFL